MSLKTFSPHSRQQDERTITRVQRDYSAGMFADIPASNISDTGVAYLKNYKNFGYCLTGRTGSKEWGNVNTYAPCASLPTFQTGLTLSSNTVSDNIRTCTITGYSFTSADIGRYIVFSDGKHERIKSRTSSSVVKTRTTTTDIKTGTVDLRYQVNAIYFHKLLKKIILHIGTDIYVAHDLSISAWDLAFCESQEILTDGYSIFDEINNDVILFNSSGVYKIDISDHPTDAVFYYKINSAIPDTKLTEPSPNVGTYGRRYVYGLGKLSGSGQNRTRQTTGVDLETDSGTNDTDTYGIDYAEYRFDVPRSDGSDVVTYTKTPPNASGVVSIISGAVTGAGSTVSSFSLPAVSGTIPDKHWDVYTVWGTADVGEYGMDAVYGEGNNDQAFAWLADIPISKSFLCNVDPGLITVVSGTPSKYDNGSLIYYYNVTTFESATITGVNVSGSTFTCTTRASKLSGVPAYIGATSGATLTASGGYLTPISGDVFSATDIRRRIFMTDGSVFHISGVSGVSGLTVETTTITTPMAGCWGEGTRNFFDDITDEEVKARLTGYPLYQRLYTPIVSSSLGIVTPGWMFTAEQNKNRIYCSQIPDEFEYLAGYHHPQYQETFVKDGIRGFGEITNTLCVYCKNSTNTITLTDVEDTALPELGVSITSLTGVTQVDMNIGVLDYSSIVNLDISKQIMITNEPAIRIFDGKKFSENLASQRITNELRKFQFATSAVYTPYMGYVIWGNNE